MDNKVEILSLVTFYLVLLLFHSKALNHLLQLKDYDVLVHVQEYLGDRGWDPLHW